MKEIDRRGRTLIRVIMWGMWLLLHGLFSPMMITAHTENEPQKIYILYGILFLMTTFGVLYGGHYMIPRAYFSEEGVYIKRFFRKRLYLWGDIQQACILKQNVYARRSVVASNYHSTYYQFYLLTSAGIPWKPGDTEKRYRRRNGRHLLPIPLTDESRKYVEKYHGKLFLDESKGKKLQWKLVK